jgi:hypothetical protein
MTDAELSAYDYLARRLAVAHGFIPNHEAAGHVRALLRHIEGLVVQRDALLASLEGALDMAETRRHWFEEARAELEKLRQLCGADVRDEQEGF